MNKVSAIQMTATPDVNENLSIVAKLMEVAVAQDTKLVVLPEMFAIAGLETTAKLKVSEHLGSGLIQDFLSAQAKQHGVWIVGGTIPIKSEDPNRIKAACLVFNDQGECVAQYNKIHLFDVVVGERESYQESATTIPGTDIVVVDTPVGKLGLSVCYDIRFPELYRKMFNAGAEIFAVPAAFTVPTGKAHWEVLTRSRAIENFCYLIGACQTGTQHNGRKTYGHSLIVNPWGEVVALLPDEVGVITADIDLNRLKEIRTNIPVDKHQKYFFN